MTKEQLLSEWGFRVDGEFSKNLEAVIANEIAKVQEAQPQKLKGNCSTFDMSRLVDQEYKPTDQVTDQLTDHVQHKLNPISEAYERGEKIRRKDWYITHWIKKHSDTEAIDEPKYIYDVTNWAFRTEPNDWELYTEPAEQPAKPFDKERFEAMFRAVVASGKNEHWEDDINVAKWAIEQLDAYYASKEGGNNE